MKHFVFLFREHPSTKLSDAGQKRRAEEVRAWALRQISEGRKLDPRLLVGESHRVNLDDQQAKVAGDEGLVVAITFLEARDFDEAVQIAESHPGAPYGVSVEVHEWTSPVPQPSAAPY
jgi:FtsZ-interacting cell division protein YlmF